MTAGVGHNSEVGGIAADQLRRFVERIERVEEERRHLGGDVRSIYQEAKGNGFDTKILRQVVRLRRQKEAEREEQLHMLDLYLRALGME